MKLADKILNLRKTYGMSQDDLAGKLNVSRQAMPLLTHDFAKQSVVCYTLCQRCRVKAVAAGEGKGV